MPCPNRAGKGLEEANIAAANLGCVFTRDMDLGLDVSQPVVIFGGGPSLREGQADGRSRLGHFDERSDCVKVLAGSALNLLDPEKARAPGRYLFRGLRCLSIMPYTIQNFMLVIMVARPRMRRSLWACLTI